MNVRYTRCGGAELCTEDGRRVIDFLSGFCVHLRSEALGMARTVMDT